MCLLQALAAWQNFSLWTLARTTARDECEPGNLSNLQIPVRGKPRAHGKSETTIASVQGSESDRPCAATLGVAAMPLQMRQPATAAARLPAPLQLHARASMSSGACVGLPAGPTAKKHPFILLVEEQSQHAGASVAGPAATAPVDASWPTGTAHAPVPGRSPQAKHPSCRCTSSPSALHPCCSAALNSALGSTGSVRFRIADAGLFLAAACRLGGGWHSRCVPLEQKGCQQEVLMVAPLSPGCTMIPTSLLHASGLGPGRICCG